MMNLQEWNHIENGYLVSCGTERTLNTLSYSDKFTGLICIDVNPNVKLYNDFNYMLIRLSSNRAEYIERREDEAEKLIEFVNERLSKSLDNGPIKEYYLDKYKDPRKCGNLELMANIYTHHLSTTLHLGVSGYVGRYNFNYLKDNETFNRIQKLIRTGNVVSMTIPIHWKGIYNLTRMNTIPISLVDSSNIHDYNKEIQYYYNPSFGISPLEIRSDIYLYKMFELKYTREQVVMGL